MADNTTQAQNTLEDMETHVPETLHPVLEAAFKYRKQIMLCVSAVLGVTVLYVGITAYNQRALTSAQAELGVILIEAAGDDKIARLEALLGDVPSKAQPAVLLELAKTCMDNGKLEQAADYWKRLEGDAGQELGYVARMGQAKCLLLGGDANAALTILKDLAGVAPDAFTVPVYRELALTAEQAGDKEQALDAYKKLAEKSVSDRPFVEYKVAQLSE